jgi:hypothetical protein
MHYTTRAYEGQIAKLCEKIEAHEIKPGMRRWPPILGLNNCTYSASISVLLLVYGL